MSAQIKLDAEIGNCHHQAYCIGFKVHTVTKLVTMLRLSGCKVGNL